MNKLTQLVSAALLIPIGEMEQWRRNRAITIHELAGGWRVELHKEPAISAITTAWKHRRQKLYGDKNNGNY
jgi:hypothetical protein